MSRLQAINGIEIKKRGSPYPVLIRLHKGGKKTQDNKPGPDLTYFRAEAEDNPALGLTGAQILAAFYELYGEKPAIIPNVQFLVDDPETALQAVNELWGTSTKGTPICTRRCTGKIVTEHIEGGSLSRVPLACNFPVCGGALDKKKEPVSCKATTRLTFFLPDLCMKLGVIGQVMLVSHSGTDYGNLTGVIDTAFADFGRLRGIGFTLYRKEYQTRTQDGKPVKKWAVYLNLMNASAQRMAELSNQEALMLAEPQSNQLALPAYSLIGLDEDNEEYESDEILPSPEPGDGLPWVDLKAGVIVFMYEGAIWYRFSDGFSFWQTPDESIVAPILNGGIEEYPARKEKYQLLWDVQAQGELRGDTYLIKALRVKPG